ncbi:MAG TPA: hypothetical protein VNS55_05110 [Nocardioides sp.]|nr:hypothetical protein [Nocardioides sp.]
MARLSGWRPVAVASGLAAVLVGSSLASALADGGSAVPEATPVAHCAPGSMPETSIQGRVPRADFTSGRAAKGYTCNTRMVSRHGRTGGFKVLRYTDAQGNTCAFYDSTLVLGKDVVTNLLNGTGLGVVVLDMDDPAHPRRTANLVTPAMLSPHESLLVNQRRGLLAAVLGTAATAPGILDVYDVRTDCRHPRLLSSTPAGVLGHESGFSRDGRTFWSSGAAGFAMTAVDLTDPSRPVPIGTFTGVVSHGLRFSPDGRTMYVADMGTPDGRSILDDPGLQVWDVSEVQDRVPHAQIHLLSEVGWPSASIPQVAQPFTSGGRDYVLEVDEFTDFFGDGLTKVFQRDAPVGAARIIDVDDPEHPFVVSDLRLQVHDPAQRTADVLSDPGASSPVQGYAAHYCSVPRQVDPQIAACSMIASGLRLFDISDVEHPREVGYYNLPAPGGGWAMSQPAWDPAHHAIWYTDAANGFFDVRLTGDARELLGR